MKTALMSCSVVGKSGIKETNWSDITCHEALWGSKKNMERAAKLLRVFIRRTPPGPTPQGKGDYLMMMHRVRKSLRSEISPKQFGFMPDIGTRNGTLTLSMLMERCIEMQKDLHLFH
ncbi:hypothetical protein PoB_006031900 [Plakobranchus ocellatus]|uniref:Reverse transcriptase n=1 Tax=Plakobranchus ocellatus TaxID=259542 RepID=A0AAV4CPL6_9GAST|nr:hypothetical protein PoB_006031900 [Plakobranchus ocellatus]